LPIEIYNQDEFVKMSDGAEYCSVKRLKKIVKLKLRTRKQLYTLKADPLKVEEIIKKLKCKTREI